MELDRAVAVVTGGASGLGAATAAVLAERGAHVVIADRDESGKDVATRLSGTFVQTDITSEEQVEDLFRQAAEQGPVRVLINCAGRAIASRTLQKDGEPHTLVSFDRVVKVNLLGTFNCTRLGAAAMARTEPNEDGERGVIINTASVAAFDGQIGQVAYSASKGGIVGMTLPLARDLASVGIRVNTIAPGLFDTPIYGSGEDAEAFKAKLGQSVVFPKRLGKPEEFAHIALALVENAYFNGEVVRLDGAIRLPPR